MKPSSIDEYWEQLKMLFEERGMDPPEWLMNWYHNQKQFLSWLGDLLREGE